MNCPDSQTKIAKRFPKKCVAYATLQRYNNSAIFANDSTFLIVFIEVRANTLRHSHNQGCSHVPINDDSDEFPLY